MIRLLTVIGARPQIIKSSALSRTISRKFEGVVEERILHTGQHYDPNMSQIFFEELTIPKPNYNLNVGSGKHGEQTAKMIAGVEDVLLSEHFDGIVLYGDTNSTLAGAIAASKLHIPIFHIEAGLRSFNMSMPEEVNRIVCDQLSSICFCPTQTGVDNLKKEGFLESIATFANGKNRVVVNSGDVMYDNSQYFSAIAEKKCDILEHYKLQSNKYILSTIHRDNNTDNAERLTEIFSALLDISERNDIKIVLPLHPRTAKLLPTNLGRITYERLLTSKQVVIIPPASFFEMIVLEKNAKVVMTDSGGVQKEAFFFERPCIILRPETEWTEIIDHKAGIIADANKDTILDAYTQLQGKNLRFPALFGDGHAAETIINNIIEYCTNK